MKPKFRISKTNKGYVVEYLEKGVFSNKWKPYSTYLGLNEAFPFTSEQYAYEGLISEIRNQIHEDRKKIKYSTSGGHEF